LRRQPFPKARQASAISEAVSSNGREVLRQLAYDLASEVAVEVLTHLPQNPGVGDNDQAFYGLSRLSLFRNAAVAAAKSSSTSRRMAEPV
jgi:hypothetical protein